MANNNFYDTRSDRRICFRENNKEEQYDRQRLGIHCLQNAIVEPDNELSICWATVQIRFRDNAFMESIVGTLLGCDFYSVLPAFYKRKFIGEFRKFLIEIRQTDIVQKEFQV
jgi:hypothetical protein